MEKGVLPIIGLFWGEDTLKCFFEKRLDSPDIDSTD